MTDNTEVRTVTDLKRNIENYINAVDSMLTHLDIENEKHMAVYHARHRLMESLALPHVIDSPAIKSCDSCKHLSNCRFWKEAPENGATRKFYIKHCL